MRAITHYEVYVVKLGRWALHTRLGEGEKERALDIARAVESESGRPTQVLEEILEILAERSTIRVVAEFGHAPTETQGPSTDTNLGSRIFMVGVNALGIGAIITILLAIALSSFREAGAVGNALNMLLLFIFGAAVLLAGLMLVKIYIPTEWILWRGKGVDSQRRVIEALLYGTPDRPPAPIVDEPEPTTPEVQRSELTAESETEFSPFAADAPEMPPQLHETNADQGEQTSFKIETAPADEPSPVAETDAHAPENLIDSATAVMDALLEKERAQLLAFTDSCTGALMATRSQLQSFEHVGLNLYLAGAAAALSERYGFADTIRLEFLRKALEHSGTNPSVASAFAERLDVSAQRPRFRKIIDTGHAAMTAHLEGKIDPDIPALPDIIQLWADPSARAAEVKKVTFLLTDIVGSTALTSKLGNAAAQRIVRAHNAAVRAAAKNFRGTEVKHTGDGILLIFPDPAAAGRAAIEIQQEGTAYARDNPDAPLAMRLGIHAGEASFEEGEYFGPVLAALSAVCAAAGESQIYCSEEAKTKCVGPTFRFQHMGKQKLKASDAQITVHKLDWTPKARVVKGPLEYRQIGGKTIK